MSKSASIHRPALSSPPCAEHAPHVGRCVRLAIATPARPFASASSLTSSQPGSATVEARPRVARTSCSAMMSTSAASSHSSMPLRVAARIPLTLMEAMRTRVARLPAYRSPRQSACAGDGRRRGISALLRAGSVVRRPCPLAASSFDCCGALPPGRLLRRGRTGADSSTAPAPPPPRGPRGRPARRGTTARRPGPPARSAAAPARPAAAPGARRRSARLRSAGGWGCPCPSRRPRSRRRRPA